MMPLFVPDNFFCSETQLDCDTTSSEGHTWKKHWLYQLSIAAVQITKNLKQQKRIILLSNVGFTWLKPRYLQGCLPF